MNIEKGIPIPPKKGKHTLLLHKMEIGDSVLVDRTKSTAMRYAAKKAGFAVVTREEGDKTRVWKVDKA